MCNNLKNGNRVYPIPEWGFGYKVFSKCYGRLKSPYRGGIFPHGEWVEWDSSKAGGQGGEGFCFFHTKKDIKYWGPYSGLKIHRIRYRKGLGRRRESYYMSSLCKEFKILKEVDIKELR